MRTFALLLTALVLLPAARASAGTYAVVACDAAPHGANNAWKASGRTADGRIGGYSACPVAGDRRTNGLVARTTTENAGMVHGFSGASVRIAAPSGAKITGFSGDADVERRRAGWTVGLRWSDRGDHARSGYLQACLANDPPHCSKAGPVSSAIPSADFLDLLVVCVTASCDTARTAHGPAASVQAFSATVQITDTTPPAVQGQRGGLWTSSGPVAGSQTVGFDGVDEAVGIRSARVLVDGVVHKALELTSQCDATRVRSCPARGALDDTVDTAQLSAGTHVLRLETTDTAGNVGVAERSFQVAGLATPTPPRPLARAAGLLDFSRYLNQPGRTHAVTCVKLIGDNVPLYDALGRDTNGRLTQAMLRYKRYSGKDKPQVNDLCPPGYARLDAKFRKGQPVRQIAVGPRQFVFHRGGLGYSAGNTVQSGYIETNMLDLKTARAGIGGQGRKERAFSSRNPEPPCTGTPATLAFPPKIKRVNPLDRLSPLKYKPTGDGSSWATYGDAGEKFGNPGVYSYLLWNWLRPPKGYRARQGDGVRGDLVRQGGTVRALLNQGSPTVVPCDVKPVVSQAFRGGREVRGASVTGQYVRVDATPPVYGWVLWSFTDAKGTVSLYG